MVTPALDNTALKIESAALTDRGRTRPLNEDAVYELTMRSDANNYVGLYLVCDGLGGYEAGDVASHTAVQTVLAELGWVFSSSKNGNGPNLSTSKARDLVEQAVTKANTTIRDQLQSGLLQADKAGTTLTMALAVGDSVTIANVGDSRTYVWRQGHLLQLTEDHSLVSELLKNDIIDEAEGLNHPMRNVITQALGTKDEVEVDTFEWVARPGDRLMLCSDGLWQAFPDRDELAARLAMDARADEICWQLAAEANQRDGSDNISVVVVRVEEG